MLDIEGQVQGQHSAASKQLGERSKDDQRKINSECTKTQDTAEVHYEAAEQEAERKRAEAEWRAAHPPQNIFEEIGRALEDAFTAIFEWLESVICAIFDFVCNLVTGLFEALTTVVGWIVDAALAFAKIILDAFAQVLKAIVQALFANAFPEIAKALCDAIDAVVGFVQDVVNAIGNALKNTINGILNAIRDAILFYIKYYQGYILTILAAAQAILLGDWRLFIVKALTALLRIAGIPKEDMEQFIGNVYETLDAIVSDPGKFFEHVGEAVLGGFEQFGENIGTHLQEGLLDWLTGTMGDMGIRLPKEFNLAGVFDLVLQVLGITGPHLREKAEEHFGEGGGMVVEFVWGFIEPALSGDWEGLLEHMTGALDNLVDMVGGGVTDMLMENVIVADTIHDVAMGMTQGASDKLEGVLGDAVPVVISLISNLLHIEGVGDAVRGVIGEIRGGPWTRFVQVGR